MNKQLELFPELYQPEWECEHCGKDTSRLDYDYLGNGYNHLKCDLEKEFLQESSVQQEWPGLDAINRDWV
jgi:hypothetical protein